jgi:hypothetical protein
MSKFLFNPEDFVKACEYADGITIGDRTLLDVAKGLSKDSVEILHFINDFIPE